MRRVWPRIAAIVRERIDDGTYDGRLPSTHKLARELGVSQDTVCAALKKLAEEGLIEITPHWPATVRVRPGSGAPPDAAGHNRA